MNGFIEKETDNWKEKLRSEIITAILDDPQKKAAAEKQVGYYYMCCAPSYIYKYYSDKPEKLETVKNNKMWYSAPVNFNDVFDCDISVDEKELFNSLLQMNPDKRQIRKGSPMWIQLKGVIHKEIQSLQSTFEDLKTTTGISCLSELNDSLLMWAHYANNHRGMCVEYNLLEINRQLGFSPVPIIYSDTRVCLCSNNINTIKTSTTKIFIESLTSKSPEWSYEQEWRIIRDEAACGTAWDSEHNGALLDMICPRSIILGCMATPEFEASVHNYCETNNINLYKMAKSADQYKLEKKPILEFNYTDM